MSLKGLTEPSTEAQVEMLSHLYARSNVSFYLSSIKSTQVTSNRLVQMTCSMWKLMELEQQWEIQSKRMLLERFWEDLVMEVSVPFVLDL